MQLVIREPFRGERTLRGMEHKLSDAADELLWGEAVADGRGVAFGEVFDRHVQAVYRQCRRLSATVCDAEDLTSLVFLEAWRRRDRVRFVDGSVRPWLLVTATNVARNAARARRRYDAVLARLPHDTTAADVADEVVDSLAALERSERLRAALASLRRHESEAIAMCDLAELSYADAAAALHVSVGTVKSRLSRGRAHLRAAFSGRADLPEEADGPWPEPLAHMFAHTPGGTS